MNYWELIIARTKLLCRRKKIIIFTLVLPLFVMGIINFMFDTLPDRRDTQRIELGIAAGDDIKLPFSFLNGEEFHLVYGTREKIQTLLKEKKIDAYITAGNEVKLYINDMGYKQSIIKGYLDSETQRNLKMDSSKKDESFDKTSESSQINQSNLIVNMTVPMTLPDKKILAFLYITALLCILGARWGFEEMKELVPEHSGIGKKLRFSSAPKWKVFLIHFSCVYILQTVCILIFSFIIISTIGNGLQLRRELYFLTAALGSLGGILTGLLIGSIKKLNLKVKDIMLNIIMVVMILAAFFTPAASRYYITSNLPYIKLINPPSLITEMLYCITLQDGFFLLIKDGLLLLLYNLLIIIWIFINYKRQEE